MNQHNQSGKSWRLWLWSSVVVLLGAGALAAWQLRAAPAKWHRPGQVPMAPIDADALAADVRALANSDPGGLSQLLIPTSSIKQFAERAASGKTTATARAQALVEALRKRRTQRAYVDWSRVEPRRSVPLTAAQTLSAIERAGAQRQLYPLELAALAVAALRSLDVPAMIAEVYAFGRELRPLDPSGRFGYYAVFVPDTGASPPVQQHGRVYDAYGGRSRPPAPGDFVVLNDAQAVGAALALRAMHALRVDLAVDVADRDSKAALKLLPKSPYVHGARAAVLLTVGHPATPASKDRKTGAEELEAARKLRDGAAQRNNLALHALTRQDARGALRDLGDVLTKMPEYALAHATLAAALLMQHELQGARAQLDLAAKWDPELVSIPQLRAQLLVADGKADEALAEARRAVALNPQDAGSLFILARIEQRLALSDDVRKHVAQVVERTPAPAREKRRAQLRNLFGEDVLPGTATRPAQADASGAAGGHASL